LLPDGTDSEHQLASGEICALVLTAVPMVFGVALTPDGIMEHILELEHFGSESGLVPHQVLQIVKSKACRGSIMFGDALSIETSQTMLENLANCKRPFSCAHGRTNVAVLMDL
jgi:DNA mismatch repair protein MLH3